MSDLVRVENLCDPTDHHVHVNLAHKFDLHGVDFLASTKAVSFCQDAFQAIFGSVGILLEYDIRFDVLSVTVRRHLEWKRGRRADSCLQVLKMIYATPWKSELYGKFSFDGARP